ncbi:McrB family protein [Aeromonas jandaei]|uniref:McrB family protein n=1 Tax=Aeromonas jandaei TaxID=650 RepID=UPI001C03E913|nr:AAA family ATPase [Aeromonas jandaei]QWL68000.1 AAA family ATPase [Aeromonas jandaei]
MKNEDISSNKGLWEIYSQWPQTIQYLFTKFIDDFNEVVETYDAFIVNAGAASLRFGLKEPAQDKKGKVFIRVLMNSSSFGVKIKKSLCISHHPDFDEMKEVGDSFIIYNISDEAMEKNVISYINQIYKAKTFTFPSGRKGYVPSDYQEHEDPDDNENIAPQEKSGVTKFINQILFGPPGTGKTYNTVTEALDIIEPEIVEHNLDDRDELQDRFGELVAEQRIQFVTFHQSFSYEDFIEGIKAESQDGVLHYRVVDGLFKQICLRAEAAPENPYVLIIDEINRGNISRIFGELITLLEPSKRLGAEEELKVVLPYSKRPFGVPKNLYLIGTMNTADRSLAGLDLALRRRFFFKEMPPRPDLLDSLFVEGIQIGELLRTINRRITALLGRDYCLGHALFMPLKQDPSLLHLGRIFQKQVLPLLQEYFFEDWQKIALVLNDHRKSKGDRFVTQDEDLDLQKLFGEEAELGNLPAGWKIKAEGDSVWSQAGSYMGITAHNWRKIEQSAEVGRAQ